MRIDDAAIRLEALGNPTRLRIYRMLVRAGEPKLAVGKLQSRLGAAASTLSHRLKTPIVVGLITQERDGTTLICRANYPMMRGLMDFWRLSAAASTFVGIAPRNVVAFIVAQFIGAVAALAVARWLWSGDTRDARAGR